jgi:hypothetical protein
MVLMLTEALSYTQQETLNYRLVTEKEQGLNFLYLESFLSDMDCQHLIETFERCHHLTFRTPTDDRFFDNRFLWNTSLPSTESYAIRLMQYARFRAIHELCKFFQEPELYSDTIQLVKWSPGMEMPSHADNAHPDGSPHNTPYRKYASVIYLNDDYEGGELYIKPLQIKVKTKRGLLLGFRGDFSHEHGVVTTTRGVRYTMPGWYSDDIKYRDPSCLEMI